MKNIFKSWKFYAVVLFILVFGYPILFYLSAEKVEVRIDDKERVTLTKEQVLTSKYLVYTDIEVFENVDEKLFLKFNSSDVQNELKLGGRYVVRVAGWRIPLFSWYRNVISVHEELEAPKSLTE